jgi:hypothetical protein
MAYDSYSDWYGKSDAPGDQMSQVRFAIELQKKGFQKKRGAQGWVWAGFRVLGAMELAEKDVDEDEDP